MNFNPLAQFNSFDSDDDDDTSFSAPPPMVLQPPPTTTTTMAIPLMQANGRIARPDMLDGEAADDSELSEGDDAVAEPVQFTVKHLKQQRQSVLAFNAGGPLSSGQPDPKLAMELIALNQKIQSLQGLLDKSRNKARQQAVDLEDAEDRVTQLEDEAQQLNDKVRQREHAISNMEFELQRALKKDKFEGLEQQGFSDKLKLFQSKIAMNSLDSSFRKPPAGANKAQSPPPGVHRLGSIGATGSPHHIPPADHSLDRASISFSPPQEPKTITITEKIVETVVDETKVKQLEEQVKMLLEQLARKEVASNSGDATPSGEPTISQAEFMALGEELASYQAQVEKLQEQSKEFEEMLKQNQETIQNERLSLKDAKDEWYIEEQRLLNMIDELHTSIQQTGIDVREYKEQIVALQARNQQQQSQLALMIQQKARPTISLPPTPKSTPLMSTAEVSEAMELQLQNEPALEPDTQPHQKQFSQPDEPIQLAPLVVITTADDDDDDGGVVPPPPTTPRRSTAAAKPSLTIADLTQPIVVPSSGGGPPPIKPVQPQQQPPPIAIAPAAVAPVETQDQSPEAAVHTDGEKVYEENVDDGELITKGLLTKLGIDASGKPSSKRHFFALFATKTQYSEYYGAHVKAACELRWGRQESDYTSYPYGATVTDAFVAAQAITYLRGQGTNGQTLAAMVRPEDVGRLLVMSTVDSRYVLLMCRDSEKGTATGAERAVAWCDSVKLSVKKNSEALGVKQDDDEDEDLHTPIVSPMTAPPSMPSQPSSQPSSPKPSLSSNGGPPPILAMHRESTVTPLAPSTPKMQSVTVDLQQASRLSGSQSFSSNGTPALGPAPSPAHFMTRPLLSPQVQAPVTPSPPQNLPPMKGTLTKFIHYGKSWHTKYFSLTSTTGVIQWGDAPTKYKYHEFVKSVLRGQDKDLRIDPKAMKKANFFYNPDLMFSVQTTGKTLYLMAPTEESLSEWIDALERALFNQTQGR